MPSKKRKQNDEKLAGQSTRVVVESTSDAETPPIAESVAPAAATFSDEPTHAQEAQQLLTRLRQKEPQTGTRMNTVSTYRDKL